jgi:hypothetical protein
MEKNGIRSIERITGHHKDTIGLLIEDLAFHAELVKIQFLSIMHRHVLTMDKL